MTSDLNRGDRLVKKQIISLNRHLPRQRKFLDDLILEERPHVVGADSVRHRFKKDELKKISEILPVDAGDFYSKINITIFIYRFANYLLSCYVSTSFT